MRFLTFFAVLIHSKLLHEVNAECTDSPTKVGGSFAPKDRICSGALIFEEQFNELRENLWNHENQVDGAGNGEFEQYVNDRAISYVKDGNLFIKPKIIGDGPLHDGFFNPVQSARMTTQGKLTFKYGRLEARAQIPAGDWLWPAIWMMPQNSKYGQWPTSGEIDILESRGNKNLMQGNRNIGTPLVFSTLHWGKSAGENQFQRTHWEKTNNDGYDTGFHTYSVEWTPDYMAFKVDGEEIGRVTPPGGGFYELGQLSGNNPWGSGSKMAPFDDDFYIIVNLAVGGTSGYFPDDVSNPKPWKNSAGKQAARDFWNNNAQWRPTWNEQTEQSALKVDYIKLYAL